MWGFGRCHLHQRLENLDAQGLQHCRGSTGTETHRNTNDKHVRQAPLPRETPKTDKHDELHRSVRIQTSKCGPGTPQSTQPNAHVAGRQPQAGSGSLLSLLSQKLDLKTNKAENMHQNRRHVLARLPMKGVNRAYQSSSRQSDACWGDHGITQLRTLQQAVGVGGK